MQRESFLKRGKEAIWTNVSESKEQRTTISQNVNFRTYRYCFPKEVAEAIFTLQEQDILCVLVNSDGQFALIYL